jgi:hypothetical protein
MKRGLKGKYNGWQWPQRKGPRAFADEKVQIEGAIKLFGLKLEGSVG